MKNILAIVFTCAAALATAASAQAPEVSKRIFSDADLNRDGEVDLSEFHKDIVRSFHALDLNRDGYITITEIRAIPDQRRIQLLERALRRSDKNGDSRLSFKEVVEARMAFFDKADRNSDDRLTLAEVTEYDAKMDERLAEARKARAAKKK